MQASSEEEFAKISPSGVSLKDSKGIPGCELLGGGLLGWESSGGEGDMGDPQP